MVNIGWYILAIQNFVPKYFVLNDIISLRRITLS